MNREFVRNRITRLRLEKGISEYQMSLDLGHSRGYIQNISSGKALPSVEGLLEICDYFEITPADFFDDEQDCPALTRQLITSAKDLPNSDVLLLLNIVERLKQK